MCVLSFGQLYSFPARGGLFSFAFVGLTNTGKRPLPWVEIHCVEHARGLRQNPHVILHVVWAHLKTVELLLSNAWETVSSRHSRQTFHGACGLKSADPWQRYLSRIREPSERKRKETSASWELYSLNGRNKVMSTAKWSCQSLS